MINYNPFIRFARLARDVARIRFKATVSTDGTPPTTNKVAPVKDKPANKLKSQKKANELAAKAKAKAKKRDPDTFGGNVRAQWLQPNIISVLKDPNHIGVDGNPLSLADRDDIIQQGNERLASKPTSTKGPSTWLNERTGELHTRKTPVNRTFEQVMQLKPHKRNSAEKDLIEQMTNEYAFSPRAIAKGKIPSGLPQIKNIPGNSELKLNEQKTFGQTLDEFSESDSGYYAGAGVVTIHGKQYLPGQGIPQAELDKLEDGYNGEYHKLINRGDHLPGSLTKDKEAAKILGNSKAKLVPKGKSTYARLFTTATNVGQPLDIRRKPATIPETLKDQLIGISRKDSAGNPIDSISRSDLIDLLPENHVAHRVLTTDDMRMTYKALVNGVAAYNSAHSNELRAGASAIGVFKRNWYRDSSKLFHAMFGLHDNGHDINHEDNSPIVIARKAQKEFTEWSKSPSQPKSAFLTSAIDSARFAAVLAATSPGISVKSNLVIALHAWDAWEEYKEKTGPPKDHTYQNFVDWVRENKREGVTLAKEEAEGGEGKGSDTKPLADWIKVVPREAKVKKTKEEKKAEADAKKAAKKAAKEAAKANPTNLADPEEEEEEEKTSQYGASILTALMGDEKKLLGLSTPLFEGGPKIENFRLACWGLSDKAVLDVWESYAAGVPQARFGQEIKVNKNDPNDKNLYTDVDYKFFAAGFNEQADLLNKIQVAPEHPASQFYNSTDSTASKKNWEAADVQASGWCGLKGIIEYSVFNHMTLDQALDNMTVGDMDKVEEFSNLGGDILNATNTKDTGLAAFMENTQRRHTNSENVTSSGGESNKQTKSLKELLKTIKKGGVSPDTPIIKLIPDELIGHARAFLNRMAVNSGSGATAAFMSQAAKALIHKAKKLGQRLKFAQFTQAPGGMTGTPVATRTNQPFSNAVAKSPGGKNLAQGALGNQINAKGGVNTTAQNAVGDWPNGSEESIVHTAPQGTDPRRLKYLGAWHGISGQKKSVLVFHPNPKGPDSLYHMVHPSTDMGEVREQLIAAGINYKTLLPGKTSTRVMVYDPNRGMRNTIDQFATNNNLNVVENIGQGEIVGHNGDWNSAGALPKSRQAYTNIIGEYEQNRNQAGPANNTSGAPTNGTGTSTGQAQQLSRKTTNTTATKAKIKFDRSRRVLEGFLRQHNTPNKELPPVGDLLSQDLQNIKPEHLSKYQQLIPDAKWSDIEGAVTSLQKDPSLYDDMTSESNRREMYCKEHARTVLQSSGLKKLIDSLRVQNLIPEHAQHLIEDAKDGDYFSLEAISSELQHSVPSLRAFSKAAEKEYNKAGKAWDKMRTGQPQKFAKKKSAHAANQYRAGPHGVAFRGLNYNGGQFAPKDDGVKRFQKDSNLTHMIKQLRGP